MAHWIAFERDGHAGFGLLEANRIAIHRGDPFSHAVATGDHLDLATVTIGLPCQPRKFFGLWNNFHAAAVKSGYAVPQAPLFFLKPSNTYRPSGATIAVPEAAGRVIYEGELGLVIGRPTRDVSEDDAAQHIFGYTCVNDVTSVPILKADDSFAQWTRAKGLDGFGPFGPVIATDLDPAALVVRTLVNGRERQNYPVADMIFSPAQIVAFLSRGMTLEAGDIIACGTSNGAGPIPKGATVEVVIEGIGTLSNRFE